MRLGVTGATGFLGASLVRALASRAGPADRLVLFRGRRPGNPLIDPLELPAAVLDVRDAASVNAAVRDLDILYHVAGLVTYAARDRKRAWEVNALGTRNVLHAARANGVPAVICVSSVSVLGAPPVAAELADETNDRYAPGRNPVSFSSAEETLAAVDSSLRGDWSFLDRVRVPYFDSKLAGFEVALRAAAEGGLRVVLALPGTAVGPGETGDAISGLVRRVAEGRLRMTFAGGTSFCSSADVAEGIRLAGLHGKNGEVYIVTGVDEDNLSYREFMLRIASVARADFGMRPPRRFLVLPRRLARAAARVAELLAPEGALSAGLALAGGLTHRFTCRRARERLGYQPRVLLDEAIRECIAFSRAAGDRV